MKTLLTGIVIASIGLVGLGAGHVMAQAGHDGHHRSPASAVTTGESTVSGLSEGTVRRVNAAAGTVTIAHGPLANLDMPPMTMTFRLSGDASLDGLASGDKVRFAADKDGDEFVVSAIEKQAD